MLTDCYEKGHTSARLSPYRPVCLKCGEELLRVRMRDGVYVWHTQAELDRLWKGVDRGAVRILSEEEAT